MLSGGSKKEKNKAVAPVKEKFNPDKIYPKLYIPDQGLYENEDIYILKYKHGQLPPLKENQLQLHTYRVEQLSEDEIIVHAFIRHGITSEIQLEDASIVLRDENEQSILKEQFSLNDLGVLPPLTSIPHAFEFNITALPEERKQNIEKWSIGFEIQLPHQLVYEPAWEKSLTDEQRKYFETAFGQCPPLGEDELNFMLLSAQKTNKGIHVTVMIRNGKKQDVEISQLPLILQGSDGQTIAQGSFTMDKFNIPANSSKPWIFIFPKESVLIEEPLEKVKLAILQ